MKGSTPNPWSIVGIAWELGYLIAIPLIGLALLGRFLDRILSSSPLFFLGGVLVAIVLSGILVYRKTMRLLEEAENSEKKQ